MTAIKLTLTYVHMAVIVWILSRIVVCRNQKTDTVMWLWTGVGINFLKPQIRGHYQNDREKRKR